MTREQARFYLAGIIDGEGHVLCRWSKAGHWERGVVIANTDKEIIAAVVECCEVLEYDYGTSKRKRQDPRWNDCYIVKICGIENLRRMVDDVPIRSPQKIKALRDSLATVKKPQLSGRQKRIVDAMLVEGVSSKEIAVVIGCDVRTIQYRKQKLARLEA